MTDDPPKRAATKKPKTRASRTNPDTKRRSEYDVSRLFTPDTLESTTIALPLLTEIGRKGTDQLYDVIVDVNRDYPGGRNMAQQRIWALIDELVRAHRAPNQGVHDRKTRMTKRYVFGRLRGDLIQKLVRKDRERAQERGCEPALHRVWPDFQVVSQTHRSVGTVKADVARSAFGATGHNIVWAVLDSGIQGDHPHFSTHANLDPPRPLRHCDFTIFGEVGEEESERAALTDGAGHGTYMAGIIAGEVYERIDERLGRIKIKATFGRKDEHGMVVQEHFDVSTISGMAPACKLLSLKVLDENGCGPVSNLIAACEKIHEINENGSHIRIHGVNMSVGYDFESNWFTSGQSPLCVEVDRLVRAGVVVVVAAGNTGYGWSPSAFRGPVPAGMDMTITDPGNAELAITVGSTHSENPLRHGVSYFSSKGPTGDGRMKPDLVAPGENILSCRVARNVVKEETHTLTEAMYGVGSGTSVSAAHVSGIIAAFLSVCPEFIGRPEEIKEIFTSNATDLNVLATFKVMAWLIYFDR